jgi:serine/threonine protein kinase
MHAGLGAEGMEEGQGEPGQQVPGTRMHFCSVQVDVWACGVLAFELIVGKPPFEVNNESETAAMIMTSNRLPFPAKHSPLWADFVRQALEKRPSARPSASVLLDHPWLKFHKRKHARDNGQVRASWCSYAWPPNKDRMPLFRVRATVHRVHRLQIATKCPVLHAK